MRFFLINFVVRNVFSENRAVYKIMWKSVVGLDKPQMAIYYGA